MKREKPNFIALHPAGLSWKFSDQHEPTKTDLRRMLTEAVQNTATTDSLPKEKGKRQWKTRQS